MASRSHRGSRAAAAPARRRRARSSGLASIARTLAAHEHRSAALLLGLLVLAYLWPALVAGRVLSPTALLYLEPPWNAVRPAGAAHWINRELGDVPYAYYAWDVLARRLIHAGTFPAWNPYAFAGTPLWANSQIAWLSPFSLPLWILPLNYGLGVAAALKLWAAGFGTYLLARELRLGFWAALVAGTAFALCSFNVLWLSYGVFVSVAAMLPWALWLTERLVRGGRARAGGPALAGVLAVALLGGHPGTQLHLLAAVALYAVVRTAAMRGASRRERGTRLAIVGASVALGLLLAAVVLLPAQRAAAGTWGSLLREHGASALPGAHMPAGVARSVLFPDWWGRPGDGVFGDHGTVAYRERTFFAGAATLVLALVALLSPGAWRRKAPFALLGALGLAVALRLPGLYEGAIALPGFDRVQNSRIYLWFVFALAILAGFGAQRVADTRGRLGRAWLAVAGAVLAGIAAIVGLEPDGATWSTAISHALARTTERSAAALALSSVLWWLAPVAALTALLLAGRARGSRRIVPVVALLVALELLHFARGAQPMGPADVVRPPTTPAIAYLQRHDDGRRIAGLLALAPDTSTLYGLRDAGGADAPQPPLRFVRLWHHADPSSEGSGLSQLIESAPRVLGLLGVSRLIMAPYVELDSADLRTVYRGRDAIVVANRLAAPRAFVARAARVAASEDDELGFVQEARFDPRSDAIVRADEIGGRWAGTAGGSAQIVAERNDAVTLRARLPRTGLVVLGDAWAPGWTVTVDGRAARALQANMVLRGVVVPAGTHAVVWRYRVPGLRLGAALSALGLALLLAWILVPASRRAARSRGL